MAAKTPLRRLIQTSATVVVIAAVVYWATAARSINHVSGLFLGIYYLLLTLAVLTYMVLAAFPARSKYKRAAKGQVICVIPSFNEDQDAVHGTVRSLLKQTRPPDYIHVVDDGSVVPLAGFDHPLVTWHRQPNAGKREAQAMALRAAVAAGQKFDFVLTVDSDCELEPDAIWHLMREMNRRKVMGVTGTVLVRNRVIRRTWTDRRGRSRQRVLLGQSIMTRLADLNLFIFCVLSRGLRSTLGAVNPTSGALSMYRAPVVMNNLDHYLSGGTDGDDRQLCDYALMRGSVICAPRAYVLTDMPSTVKGMYRQRRRWGRSGWRFIPWEIVNLTKAALVLRLFEVCTDVLLPVLYAGVIFNVWRIGDLGILPHIFATGVVFLTAETLFYGTLRPGLKKWERITAPLLVPFYALMMFFIVYPAKYWALTKVRQKAKKGHNDWGTRGQGSQEELPLVAKLLDPYTETTLTVDTMPLRAIRRP